MRALAGYILSGRPQAIAVTTAFGLLSLVVPPLAYIISGVPVALVSLRAGPQAGLQVMLGALIVLVLALLLFGLPPALALGLLLGIWLPVAFCAWQLRRHESQGALVLAAAGVAAAYAGLLHLLAGDVTAWWREQLQPQLEQLLENQPELSAGQVLEGIMPYVNGMVAAGLVFSLTLAVLIARWLQALLYNPGGFGAEFRALVLPRWLVTATVAALAGAVLLEGAFAGWLRDLVFVTLTAFLFQGLALVHLLVKVRGWATHWLWFMYALLVLLPQFILFLASVGFADAWLRRGRSIGPANGAGPDRDSGGGDRKDE